MLRLSQIWFFNILENYLRKLEREELDLDELFDAINRKNKDVNIDDSKQLYVDSI